MRFFRKRKKKKQKSRRSRAVGRAELRFPEVRWTPTTPGPRRGRYLICHDLDLVVGPQPLPHPPRIRPRPCELTARGGQRRHRHIACAYSPLLNRPDPSAAFAR